MTANVDGYTDHHRQSNRQSYEIPISDGAIKASDLRKVLKLDPNDYGLMSYDPAFTNTASTKSAITYLDGDNGKLLYRGYPIEQLAERSTFLETAYLVLFGELPTAAQSAAWQQDIMTYTMVHENIKALVDAFRHDAHPMGMFISAVAALSSFYPDAHRHLRSRCATAPDQAPDRQSADNGGLLVPAYQGLPVHLPR